MERERKKNVIFPYLILDGGEQLDSFSCHVLPGPLWIRGWLDSRFVVVTVVKRKFRKFLL
jgi:hypothetical protein